jgi:hypothetical protein
VTVAVGNASGAVAILASEADGPSQGWTGEAATCSGAGQRSGAERRAGRRLALLNALGRGAESGTAAGAFERARARSDEGKRRGGRISAAWGQDWSGEGGLCCGAT